MLVICISFDKDIILGHAKEEIKRLESGKRFNLQDLFYGFDESNKLEKSDKMTIGKVFKNEVEANNLYNVHLTGNKKDNRIEYEKK